MLPDALEAPASFPDRPELSILPGGRSDEAPTLSVLYADSQWDWLGATALEIQVDFTYLSLRLERDRDPVIPIELARIEEAARRKGVRLESPTKQPIAKS